MQQFSIDRLVTPLSSRLGADEEGENTPIGRAQLFNGAIGLCRASPIREAGNLRKQPLSSKFKVTVSSNDPLRQFLASIISDK